MSVAVVRTLSNLIRGIASKITKPVPSAGGLLQLQLISVARQILFVGGIRLRKSVRFLFGKLGNLIIDRRPRTHKCVRQI